MAKELNFRNTYYVICMDDKDTSSSGNRLYIHNNPVFHYATPNICCAETYYDEHSAICGLVFNGIANLKRYDSNKKLLEAFLKDDSFDFVIYKVGMIEPEEIFRINIKECINANITLKLNFAELSAYAFSNLGTGTLCVENKEESIVYYKEKDPDYYIPDKIADIIIEHDLKLFGTRNAFMCNVFGETKPIGKLISIEKEYDIKKTYLNDR